MNVFFNYSEKWWMTLNKLSLDLAMLRQKFAVFSRGQIKTAAPKSRHIDVA
jgi:hypothetical protein